MSMRWFPLVLIFGICIIIAEVYAAPPRAPIPDWIGTNACTNRRRCDMNSGPVCAIDASGVIKTFENKCMVELAFCRLGSYYAIVKPGEC